MKDITSTLVGLSPAIVCTDHCWKCYYQAANGFEALLRLLLGKQAFLILVLFTTVVLLGCWPDFYYSPTELILAGRAYPPRYHKPLSHTLGLDIEIDDSNYLGGKSAGKTENGSVDPNMRIDLDVAVPSVDALFERLVLVTSFSSNHFKEGLGFIESSQNIMPNKTIIVYDIGLSEVERSQIEVMCSVFVRDFPFEKYPEHFKKLTTYAFKPTIINMVVDEFGIVYYGDASIRFKKSPIELIPDALDHHGWTVHIRTFDPYFWQSDYVLTMKEVYPIIGVDRTAVANANMTFPCISAGLMLVINNTYLQKNILKPWRDCAASKPCIAPESAWKKNHRFDQSALTLLAFKNMYKEFTPENDPTPHLRKVVSISRNTRAKEHPKVCKG